MVATLAMLASFISLTLLNSSNDSSSTCTSVLAASSLNLIELRGEGRLNFNVIREMVARCHTQLRC